MRIIIDIDEDRWLEAWLDWNEALPEPTTERTSNLKAYERWMKARLLTAVVTEPDRVRFIEEPTAEDDEDGDDGDDDD